MSTEPRDGGQGGAAASGGSGGRSDEARERAGEVKDHAGEQSRQVKDTAKEQAGQVGREAQAQARDLLGEAQQHLRGQAQQQTGQVAGVLRSFSEDLRALTEGRVDEAGVAGDYARQAHQRVESWADQVDQRGFDGLLDDLQRFARHRSGAFLATAAAAGFVVGRLGRGARDAGDSGGQTSGGPAAEIPPPTAEAAAADVDSDVTVASGTSTGDLSRPATPLVGPSDSGVVVDAPAEPTAPPSRPSPREGH